MNGPDKERAPRNRTLTLSAQEEAALSRRPLRSPLPAEASRLDNQVVCGDFIELLPQFPQAFADRPILEPRYNLTRRFGAKTNWKSAREDIWFARVANDYRFNVGAVRLKRQVIAPYRENGQPKDWDDGPEGQFRLTHPSNALSDTIRQHE